MSLHRVSLFVLALLFTAGMTSVASAGCCGWGVQAPVAYAPADYGCGGCGAPTAAVVYAQPVAPAPPPVAMASWGWGTGCGCHRAVVYAAAAEPTLIAPAPIYVVNQGPDYTGPGMMVPYRTWSPGAPYIGPGAYPYLPGYGYGYGVHRPFFAPRARLAYGHRFYGRPVSFARPALHRYYR
jgi:hypothetical protein